MLSSPVRHLLKTLLIEIGKYQKQLEVLKQILCEQYDFEPYSAFQRIDTGRKGFITPTDIREFLAANEFEVTEEDAALYIGHYAEEDPDSLGYQEFLPTLLPLENPDLRAVATQRKVYEVKPGELLPYEVEYALARVLSKEIAFHHELNPLKEELIAQETFVPNVVFASLDPYNTGFLDDNELKDFLKLNGANPSIEDLIAILRRIDRDCDGKINYKEFLQAIKPIVITNTAFIQSKRSPPKSFQSRKEADSTSKEQRRSPQLSDRPSGGIYRSPIKTVLSDRKQKETSPSKLVKKSLSPTENFSSTQKSTLQESTKKGLRSAMKRTLVSDLKRQSSPERDREGDLVENLLRVLREIINLEREIEIAKEDLAIRTDFNLFDAFRLFDRKGVGIVTAGEIEQGLNYLGIYPSKDDLYLLVRKFDRDADAKLKYRGYSWMNIYNYRFSDFCDGLIPSQAEYVKMLKSRTPINTDLALDFKQVFSQQTQRLFKGLLLLHLENEAVVEALRQKLARDPRFDTHKIFDILDQDEDGFITIFELRAIMEKYNMFVTDKDLTFLIGRFDKGDKQKISYIEFVQEITPKSPKKY